MLCMLTRDKQREISYLRNIAEYFTETIVLSRKIVAGLDWSKFVYLALNFN